MNNVLLQSIRGESMRRSYPRLFREIAEGRKMLGAAGNGVIRPRTT